MKPRVLVLLSLVLAVGVHAGSATWNLNPTSGDWNTAANWTPTTVPNGATDIATFDTSNLSAVAISRTITVGDVLFSLAAGSYKITVNPAQSLTLAGAGITNSGPMPQNFETVVDDSQNRGLIKYTGSASVGGAVIFTNHGSLPDLFFTSGGETRFSDSSSAGDGVFYNLGEDSEFGGGGQTTFYDNSTAGNGCFFNLAGSDNFAFGFVSFFGSASAGHGYFLNRGIDSKVIFSNSSTAGDGTFVNEEGGWTELNGIGVGPGGSGGDGLFVNNGAISTEARHGSTLFYNGADAANGTYIANPGANGGEGGLIKFAFDSTGGTSKMILHGNGTLDISAQTTGAITIGSLEGDGIVLLGANNLAVGSNNLNTLFGGVIGGDRGSLTKLGMASLTLTGANTYTGGTTVEGGELLTNNHAGSATGNGPVQVNGGQLGGRGIIAGAVTIGTGSGVGSILAPGQRNSRQNALTIQSALTFNSDGSYVCGVNSKSAFTDKVVANGVTINGARFSLREPRGFSLTPGTVLTVIENSSANLINGTFANLPDDATINSGNNHFRASYEGGDGNDLTLTVQ